MNRNRLNDSKVSLDAGSLAGESELMLVQPYHLYVERTDAATNMARYYALSIEQTLFGTACLIRRWGRIGSLGQTKMHHFEREEDAVTMFLALLRIKRSRGYVARPTEGPEYVS